jgi:hypothetical protein
MRANFSPLLEARIRDAAPTAREIVHARVETAADIRQRTDQWAQLDGGVPGTLEVLADGGLRLLATAGAVVGPSAVTSGTTEYRSNDGGVSQPYIDPLATNGKTYAGVLVQWKGTASNASYGAVRAWLNPQYDTTKPQYVKTWVLDLYRVVLGSAQVFWQLQPWVHATVPLASAAAGWVTFTLQDSTGKPQPFHPEAGEGTLNPFAFTGYFVRCTGLDHQGNPATNIGWGYDNTQTSFDAGFPPNDNIFYGVQIKFQLGVTPFGQWTSNGINGNAQMLALQFTPHSFSTAPVTVAFKTTAPIDLGATPANPPECVLRAETPPGTSLTAQVAADPSGSYETFLDGQTVDKLSPAIATQRKYDVQVTFTANATGDRTPILRGVGLRALTTFDLGDVCTVDRWTERVDPLTHIAEVGEAEFLLLHDGERDYQDAVTLLLSQTVPAQLYLRVYIGDRNLTKDQWLHLDDFLIDDQVDEGSHVRLIGLSTLARLKQALPVLTSDASALPVADFANPGAWTASAGTLLYPGLADTLVATWAAATAYSVGTRILDSNGNVQQVITAGTSGGAAPTWNTAFGAPTTDNTATWQNQGPVVAGAPDDTTYIQSPNNPSSAQYTATLSKISAPTIVGQNAGVTLQWRAAVAGASQSIAYRIELLQGTTVMFTAPNVGGTYSIAVQDTGQGSYIPVQINIPPATVTLITNGTGGWGNLFLRVTAVSGTGQMRLGWARLVVLGLRGALQYPPQVTTPTIGNVTADIINNQINLDGRYRPSAYPDALTNPITVAKTIAQSPTGVAAITDLTKAKTELDALMWVGGYALISTQGRLKYVPLYQVVTGLDPIYLNVSATFSPLTGPVRAVIPIGEVGEPISVTPGWRQRVAQYGVLYNWNGSFYAGEAQAAGVALTSFPLALLDAEQRPSIIISQWIATQGLAQGLAVRHVQSFGLGLLEWRFRSTYARPELEIGDVVSIQTDRFIAFDPIGQRALNGQLWATGVVVGRYDVWGRDLAIWIQSYAAIKPIAVVTSQPPVNPQIPAQLSVSMALISRAGGYLTVGYSGSAAVGSVKIASSTAGLPAAGTGTLVTGQVGKLTIGPFNYPDTVWVTVTPYASSDGSGAAGTAAGEAAAIFDDPTQYDNPTGKRLRTGPFQDGNYAATATSTDGYTLHSSVQHSGAIAVNRLLAKAVSTDPNTLDGVPEGTTYFRLPSANMSGVGGRALIDFTQAHVSKNIDNVADGSTYARILGTKLASGAIKRAATFDDGNQALIATTTDGKTTAGVTASGLLSNQLGASTQVARAAGLIGVVLNASTTSTVDVTLGTITLPANAIDATTRAIRITVWGRTSGGTGTANVSFSMFFGVGAPAITVSNGAAFKVVFECVYPTVGASGSLSYQYLQIMGGAFVAGGHGTNTASGVNQTASTTGTVTGHVSVSTTTLFLDGFHAEWIST